MSKKIIILAIPGIGTHDEGFSERLQDDLKKHSKGTSLSGNYNLIELLPFKNTNVDKNQDALYERLDAHNKFGGLSFRNFVMKAFGDGVTFERGANDPNSVYKNVHNYLRTEIKKANITMLENPGSKLVVVAASLGVHLMSTYIWDADEKKGIFELVPATADEDLSNLSLLASIGCNIPLFVSGMHENQIKAIKKRNPDFVWDNYYDKDDVLGWPIKQLSSSYNELVTDYEINSGLYVGSHIKYWDDNNFTKPFTKKLIQLLGD